MLKDFRDFAMRGNVVDLAVGIIIGVAFGSIIDSLVNDIIMPPIGLLLGKVDFSSLFINLSGQPYATLADAQAAGAATINYGMFVNTIINFIIVAFAMFILVRQVTRLQQEEPPPEPATKACPYCQMSISIKATRCPHCTSEV